MRAVAAGIAVIERDIAVSAMPACHLVHRQLKLVQSGQDGFAVVDILAGLDDCVGGGIQSSQQLLDLGAEVNRGFSR